MIAAARCALALSMAMVTLVGHIPADGGSFDPNVSGVNSLLFVYDTRKFASRGNLSQFVREQGVMKYGFVGVPVGNTADYNWIYPSHTVRSGRDDIELINVSSPVAEIEGAITVVSRKYCEVPLNTVVGRGAGVFGCSAHVSLPEQQSLVVCCDHVKRVVDVEGWRLTRIKELNNNPKTEFLVLHNEINSADNLWPNPWALIRPHFVKLPLHYVELLLENPSSANADDNEQRSKYADATSPPSHYQIAVGFLLLTAAVTSVFVAIKSAEYTDGKWPAFWWAPLVPGLALATWLVDHALRNFGIYQISSNRSPSLPTAARLAR